MRKQNPMHEPINPTVEPAHYVHVDSLVERDYALLSAGSEILYGYTSSTYVPSFPLTKPLWNLLVNKYHVEIGIVGRPEEALTLSNSHSHSTHNQSDPSDPSVMLGRCWAMEVICIYSIYRWLSNVYVLCL